LERFYELERPFFPLIDSIIYTPKITRRILYCIFSIRPTGEKHLYLISQTSTNYLPYCFNISEEQRPSQYTYQAQEGYIELPHNTTSNLYNPEKTPLP
jgi:hypothetical protein